MPTLKRFLPIALVAEVAALVGLLAYWIYLLLSLSGTLGFAAQVLAICGVTVGIGLASFVAWRVARRYHYRFSIRAMLVAVGLVGLALGLLLPRIRTAADYRRRLAGFKQAQQVMLSHNGDNLISYSPGRTGVITRLAAEELISPEEGVSHQLYFTGQVFSDGDLLDLAKHPNLQVIGLRNLRLVGVRVFAIGDSEDARLFGPARSEDR